MRTNRINFNVYGCKLRRQDLNQLWDLCIKDNFDDFRAHASAQDGISEYKADSLNDLLSELGSPRRIPQLTISASGGVNRPEGDRGIYFNMDSESIYVSVESPDETWARGRADEIREVLRKRHSFIHPSLIASSLFSTALAAVCMFAPLLSLGGLASLGEVAVVIIGSLVLGVAVWVVLFRLGRTVISPSEDVRRHWSRADKIALGILAVGVVTGAVIVYQTWGPK